MIDRGIPDFAEVLQAREAVRRHLPPTPLHRYPGLSRLLDAEVWVKHENHHPVGAFKVRGGVNLAAHLDAAARRAGLFTASTGNHGQSIAFAGRVAGAAVRVAVRVAVPEGANPDKVAAMRALGAEVVFHGPDFDTAREWIQEEARSAGARFIGPTEPELIAGVATYALEIVESLPDVDVVYVPVGGGSGAAGTSLAGKTLKPSLRVVGVQAEAAPAACRSWQTGTLTEAPTTTRAEGVATRVAYPNTQEMLRHPEHGLDDFILVSDAEMERAIVVLLEHTKNLAEHAGAAALAGALKQRDSLRGRKVVLILSGGNLPVGALREILARVPADAPA